MSSEAEVDRHPGAEPPTGRQHRLVFGDQEAVVTEVGATLRTYHLDGRRVLDGFAEEEQSTHGRGQMLLPWPGRIGDGRYRLDGREHQLPVDEPQLGNAIHGLARWANWTAEQPSEARLSMRHLLHAREGYPFSLDLRLAFALDAGGLTVTVSATDIGTGRAPFGAGTHPYLTAGTTLIDGCRLHIPAATALVEDGRLLPTGRAPVAGTDLDFRAARPIGTTAINTAYTDLERDPDGLARVSLEAPDGRRVVVWLDSAHPWVMVFTGDPLPPNQRRHGVAIEPMTCPPDAFRSGEDLTVLEPGQSSRATWGIDVTGLR